MGALVQEKNMRVVDVLKSWDTDGTGAISREDFVRKALVRACVVWDRVGSRGIAWDRVGSSGIEWDRVGLSGDE